MTKISEEKYEPFVSIALTTSKSEKFIVEQIDSLLNQAYKNLEVVISHDECGDGTVTILNDYIKKDNRVRWEYNPLEKGFRKNTEHAISMCKGDIIFLCDHDDSWYLDRVEEHVNVYKDKTIKWVYNRLVITDAENKNEIGYIEDTMPDYYRHKTLLDNAWGSCIGGAQTSYRADLLHKVMPIDNFAPAHDSWIQLAIWPAKPFFINKVLQRYRQHAHNAVGMSADKNETDGEAFKLREQQAISDNLRYLRHLPSSKVLPIWKRFFFLMAYIAKILRAKYRKIISYK